MVEEKLVSLPTAEFNISDEVFMIYYDEASFNVPSLISKSRFTDKCFLTTHTSIGLLSNFLVCVILNLLKHILALLEEVNIYSSWLIKGSEVLISVYQKIFIAQNVNRSMVEEKLVSLPTAEFNISDEVFILNSSSFNSICLQSNSLFTWEWMYNSESPIFPASFRKHLSVNLDFEIKGSYTVGLYLCLPCMSVSYLHYILSFPKFKISTRKN
jgi:hypothetical protein